MTIVDLLTFSMNIKCKTLAIYGFAILLAGCTNRVEYLKQQEESLLSLEERLLPEAEKTDIINRRVNLMRLDEQKMDRVHQTLESQRMRMDADLARMRDSTQQWISTRPTFTSPVRAPETVTRTTVVKEIVNPPQTYTRPAETVTRTTVVNKTIGTKQGNYQSKQKNNRPATVTTRTTTVEKAPTPVPVFPYTRPAETVTRTTTVTNRAV